MHHGHGVGAHISSIPSLFSGKQNLSQKRSFVDCTSFSLQEPSTLCTPNHLKVVESPWTSQPASGNIPSNAEFLVDMSDSDDDGGHPIDQVLQDRTKENKEQEVILIDDSTSDDVELANAADEEAAPAETPASRKKKKKKAKLQDPKTPADALATSAADQAERLVKTAPAALNKPLNAHGILVRGAPGLCSGQGQP